MNLIKSKAWQAGLRRWLLAGLLLLVLLLPGAAQASAGLPAGPACDAGLVSAAATPAAAVYDRVCGKLVFLVDVNTNKGLMGFSPCGGAMLLIFSQRPRDLYQYYQFKNLVVARGSPIETNRGRVRRYITGFHSYIPLSDCSQCGVNLQATQWSNATQAASFLFPTPSPATLTAAAAASLTPGATFTHTPTPLPPSATPTATLTATSTPEPSPTASPTPPPPSATAAPSPTPLPAASGWAQGWLLPVLALLLLLALGVAFFFLQRQRR